MIKNPDLIVLHANTSWYIRRFYSEFVQTLLDTGYRVAIIVPDTDFDLARKDVSVHILPMKRSGTSPYHDGIYYLSVYSLFKQLGPKAIFNFTVKPNIYGGIAAARLGIPAINTISGVGSSLIERGPVFHVVRRLYKAASRHATNVYLNTSDQAFFADLGVQAKKQVLVPGVGINLTDFRRSVPAVGNNTFLYLGRLIRDKGINEYLGAARALHNQGAKFIVAGETDPGNPTSLDPLEIETLDHEGIIEHLGFVEDVHQLLEDVDCLVLPSYAEGLSRVMLEAAAMQVGLIASDVPGCREVVAPDAGTLVPPRSTDDLITAIKAYMHKTDTEKTAAKTRARAHVEKQFSVTKIIGQYMGLLP